MERPGLQVERPGGEHPLVANRHGLAGGVLDVLAGQRGVGAEQHGREEGVGLISLLRCEGGDGLAQGVVLEAPGTRDAYRGRCWLAGDELAGADDLRGSGVGQREGRLGQGGGVDDLIEDDGFGSSAW